MTQKTVKLDEIGVNPVTPPSPHRRSSSISSNSSWSQRSGLSTPIARTPVPSLARPPSVPHTEREMSL